MIKNCLITKGKCRFLKFGAETEISDFLIIRISRENKFSARKICKILEKNKILNLAFENGFSEEFKTYFKGKINILEKGKILFSNMDKIINKLCVSYGIENGSLRLGIIPGYKTEALLKLTENISLKLKTVEIYENSKEISRLAGDFYLTTGIPVILKSTPDFTGCDMLIYLSKTELTDFKGRLIDIFDLTDQKGIKDIKSKVKNPYNISDCVFLRLMNKPFDIKCFKF